MVDSEEDEVTEDELAAFFIRVQDEVKDLKALIAYPNEGDAFVHWSVRQVSPSLTDKQVVTATSVRGARDHGMDAAWNDEKKGVFFLAQGKYSSGPDPNAPFGTAAAKDLRSAFTWLTTACTTEPRPDLKGIRRDLADALSFGTRVRMAIFVSGSITGQLRELVDSQNQELRRLGAGDIRVELYGLRRLFSAYMRRLEEADLAYPESASFRVRFPYYQPASVPLHTIVADLPLKDLYELVQKHGLSLFAKNLRVPVARSGYNEGIRRTIRDDQDRPNFWFYNNGVTAICESFEIDTPSEDPETIARVNAKKLQIVNGCQTSFSVFNEAVHWRDGRRPMDAFDNTTVLLRLIEVPPQEMVRGLAFRIARFTNSQNPITPRALRSTDPEQLRLREALKQDWRLFLEVKKGEWQRRIEEDRSVQEGYDLPYVVSNEKCGQFFVAFWQAKPQFAKGNKREIFENDSIYESIFGLGIPSDAFLLPHVLHDALELWRKERGYLKRRPETKRRKKLSRAEVVAHGDLYLMAIIGSALKGAWKVETPSDADLRKIKVVCGNLRALQNRGTHPLRGPLDDAFDGALGLLYDYAGMKIKREPDISVRNLMVRPTTWSEFQKKYGKRWAGVIRGLPAKLEARTW